MPALGKWLCYGLMHCHVYSGPQYTYNCIRVYAVCVGGGGGGIESGSPYHTPVRLLKNCMFVEFCAGSWFV